MLHRLQLPSTSGHNSLGVASLTPVQLWQYILISKPQPPYNSPVSHLTLLIAVACSLLTIDAQEHKQLMHKNTLIFLYSLFILVSLPIGTTFRSAWPRTFPHELNLPSFVHSVNLSISCCNMASWVFLCYQQVWTNYTHLLLREIKLNSK